MQFRRMKLTRHEVYGITPVQSSLEPVASGIRRILLLSLVRDVITS